MPLYKLLPNLFSISQVPILFKFFNAFLFNDAFEDILASSLIILKSFYLYQLLNSVGWSLVDAVAVP